MQATDMGQQFARIIIKQKADKEKAMNDFMSFWGEVLGDAFQDFGKNLKIEIHLATLNQEFEMAKRDALMIPVSVDPKLVKFGMPSEEVKQKFILAPMVIGDSLDEITKLQLARYQEKQ